ncbi:2-hydroxyacid dehydrogenase [Alteromonas sp. KC3]|uniref:D-2-hydroxyacid dehydrogenase n=1 Tax=unclassified Alteromonas TaxID=2614992 RepID=UPI001920449D|nr:MULTISPECIES: D-2-hydroxyacid dehydrogenase [unclassified Alteromonas]BCO20246.1 2-hydroxyacid dehydrogenase [Alteromonas sp. KC3]BCO24212.1 2-hydroxyacid dehydrogenase [Alteromonas sp. KC14]
MNSGADACLSVTILSDEAHDIATAISTQLSESNATSHSLAMGKNTKIHIEKIATSPKEIEPEAVNILLADPDLAAEIIEQCHNIKWCQSTWAGNAPLLRASKTDYTLTGLKGIFGKLMREYVFAYLLEHARNTSMFRQNQQAQPPKWEASPRIPLHGQTLGILGLGSIGKALIPVAHAFEMRVVGLSRSGAAVDGVHAMYTQESAVEFAGQADHLVNLMPDTPQTQNFISDDILKALKSHSVFINAGRGNAVDDEALIKCLNAGYLKHAVLDVFKQEPLPKDHAFWIHPKITITAHTAAESQPSDVASVFLENAFRYLASEPLLYQFDFDKGY